MENNNYIAVRSLTLLKAIYDMKALNSMKQVTFEIGEDGNTYPVFIVRETEKTTMAYDSYINKFETDDRSNDDPVLWSGFNADAVKEHGTCLRLNTRNYSVISRAFEAGQIGNMIGCRYDNGKMIYRFAHNDVLEKIKDEEDEKSRARWEAKQKKEGKVDDQ